MRLKNLFVLLFALTTCSMHAQMTVEKVKNGQYGTPQERAAEINQKMKEGLNLSSEQVPKIEDINLRYAVRTDNEVVKVKMGNWSKYWKIQAIQGDKDAELKRILTTEQFKKYAKKRDELIWQGMKVLLF